MADTIKPAPLDTGRSSLSAISMCHITERLYIKMDFSSSEIWTKIMIVGLSVRMMADGGSV
ncbi:MAG: hypothetical protein MPI95_00185 [Nitrosopumilus sp.]|nr:hypothetical protein [Nitrosopumilus sp.]MDA7957498.1 hypothetical protein [Nitrosopumilus sp.]